MLSLFLVAAGLAALFFGGEMLVRGAVTLASAFRIPPLVIGLTLVGFGTSTPELVTSLQAALAGSPGIALGNVVGSNIGNILLILGLGALIAPIAVNRAALTRDGSVLALASLGCAAILLTGEIGRPAGLAAIAALLVYLVYTIRSEQARATPVTPPSTNENGTHSPAGAPPAPLWRPVLTALAGLALTILGARLLVTGAVALAASAGISETVVGLTIVAIGTSMPELVTTVIAMRKGAGDVAFGNVIGSNIFNTLFILGITATIKPLPVDPQIAQVDIWVMLAATAALLATAITGWRITRWEGAALLAAYAAYLALLVTLAPA